MRDIIVHHYFDIDAEVIFKTLIEDIPALLIVLERIHSTLK
ncbi:HepT-like ribonuclease domain-containing protein [Anaerophaga thermohalophila]|nr:HepT-like ribonuclease domain-containing protein [Anaerophaga thermohalophila]